MSWLAWIVFVFLGIRLLVALSNLLRRQWLMQGTPLRFPMVSVLIPVRNEEKNIGALLELLLQQKYPSMEILVYDDLSEDNTLTVIEQYSRRSHLIAPIHGRPLPGGWTGKNHACHQLSSHARGEYLLFLDADVVPHPMMIESAMAHALKYELELLSLFPTQIMHSAGERITVPIMNWVLLSLLPLEFTRRLGHSSFSAANGQFMMFRAHTYKKYHFHEKVRFHKTEDIVIARLMKEYGLKIHTMLGGEMIACRMYEDFGQSVNGFSKNILDFFGGSIWAGPLFALITTLGLIPVWIETGIAGVVLFLSMAMVLRLVTIISSRQPALRTLALWPLQHGAFVWIIVNAVRNRLLGKNTWKGRNIDNL